MSLAKAQCPNCNRILEVDSSKDAAICPHCGNPYIVEKAIQSVEQSNHINKTKTQQREKSDEKSDHVKKADKPAKVRRDYKTGAKKEKAPEETKHKTRTTNKKKDADRIKGFKEEYDKIINHWHEFLKKNNNVKPYKGGYDRSRIINETEDTGRKLDLLIENIDREGKYLIEMGCDFETIREIRELISKIINESNLNVCFDIEDEEMKKLVESPYLVCDRYFDSTAIKPYRYSFSKKSLQTRARWNKKYDELPEIVDRRKEEEKRIAEERVKQIEKWEKDVAQIQYGREKERESRKMEIEDQYASIIIHLAEENRQKTLELNEQIKQFNEKKDTALNELLSLSFWNIKRRLTLRKYVDNLYILIARKENELAETEAWYQSSVRKANDDKSSLMEYLDVQLESKYSVPLHPDKVAEQELMAKQNEKTTDFQHIKVDTDSYTMAWALTGVREILAEHPGITMDEIMDKIQNKGEIYNAFSRQRIIAYVELMRDDLKIVNVIEGKKEVYYLKKDMKNQ